MNEKTVLKQFFVRRTGIFTKFVFKNLTLKTNVFIFLLNYAENKVEPTFQRSQHISEIKIGLL